LAWSGDLTVGWDEMDREHRQMVDLAGELQTAMEMGESATELKRRHAALAACAAQHFTNEEGTMLATGYPKYEEHRAEHQQLLEQLALIRDALAGGAGGGLLVTIMTGWTIPHMRGADQSLARYLGRMKTN
jgi:hemerythrin